MKIPHSFDPTPSSSLGSILIVDDEPSILAIASAILNTISLVPLKAANGEEAIEVMKSECQKGRNITLAIVDLTMPGGLSGFETMEALKQIDPAIKVIACSGFFQEGALELCQSIGFTNILAKPYTPDGFISMIRKTNSESTARPPASATDRTTSEKALLVPAAPESAPPPAQETEQPTIKRSSLVRSALARSLQSQRPARKPETDSSAESFDHVEANDLAEDFATADQAE